MKILLALLALGLFAAAAPVAHAQNVAPSFTLGTPGAVWTPRDSARTWRALASSVDGSKLAAVDYGGTFSGGQIYTSTDSGATWTARDSARRWNSVASSTNGSKLVAVVGNGQIYTSTNSGTNWTARDINRDWRAVASSADGSKLVAVNNGDFFLPA